MKNSVGIVALIALLIAITFVGNVAASCKEVANEEMLEYFCEGGQPSDLTTVPDTTEKLRITNMPLGRITADTFSRFGGNLWVLSCSQCEITDIDEDAFRQLVNLQQLGLTNNHLTTVKASWLEGLNYLTYLDLNYNNIRDIEDDVYRNLPSLVDFRISGNQLRCLNLNEMSHLKELKRMFLSENSDFACPHAVSRFLENQGVAFEPDPEWRRLASDTIVPSSYAQEDRRILDSNKRPEVAHIPSRTFHPNHRHDAEHRHRHRRPTTTVRPTTSKHQNEIPRVEPKYSPTRTEPYSSPQLMILYPLSTPETLPTPSAEWRPLEDIKVTETTADHGLSRIPTGRASMYPQHVATYETTPYPKDSLLERLQVSAVGFSAEDDDETTVGSDRSPQAGNTLTYPLYVATSNDRERTPHGSIQMTHHSDSDMVTVDSWSTDRSNNHPHWTHHESYPTPTESNDNKSPPLWSTNTPDLWGRLDYAEVHDPHKMIVDESSNTHPHWTHHESYPTPTESNDNKPPPLWSTNTPGLWGRLDYAGVHDPHKMIVDESSNTHPHWTHHESYPTPTESNDNKSPPLWSTNTPGLWGRLDYAGVHDPRKMIVDESSNTKTVPIATDPVDQAGGRSETTTIMPNVHYVRPSISSSPELMYSPANAGEFYRAPYYETTVTMHTPLLDYRDTVTVNDDDELTTTDQPLECRNRNSANSSSIAVLAMSVIITIFGHVIAEGF
ncbi:uncharacterized protein [Anoplolepis gracilipes]|uniref:uncharacterized protein n=1 Tax=Anoplolepis gracilipes TaxID=354296 RepID=UPI003B9E31D0